MFGSQVPRLFYLSLKSKHQKQKKWTPRRGTYLLTHKKFENSTGRFRKKKFCRKTKKKQFDRSFSALGEISHMSVCPVINRPGVAGAVLQTASSLINSLIKWVTEPFPPDIHNIIKPKPLELESWNFERMFAPHHVSCVTCHVSRVTSHIYCVTQKVIYMYLYI